MIVYVCVRVCLGAQCSVSRYTAPIFVSNKVCARDPLSLPSTCPQFFFIHIFKHLLSHLHFYNLMSLHHFPSLLSPLLSSPLLTSPHLTSFFPLFVNHLLISSSTPFLTIITFHPQGELISSSILHSIRHNHNISSPGGPHLISSHPPLHFSQS